MYTAGHSTAFHIYGWGWALQDTTIGFVVITGGGYGGCGLPWFVWAFVFANEGSVCVQFIVIGPQVHSLDL